MIDKYSSRTLRRKLNLDNLFNRKRNPYIGSHSRYPINKLISRKIILNLTRVKQNIVECGLVGPLWLELLFIPIIASLVLIFLNFQLTFLCMLKHRRFIQWGIITGVYPKGCLRPNWASSILCQNPRKVGLHCAISAPMWSPTCHVFFYRLLVIRFVGLAELLFFSMKRHRNHLPTL